MGSRDKPGNDPLGILPLYHLTDQLTLVPPTLIFNHMVEHETARLDAVFHALGDATRRRMLRALADGERTVGGLAAPFEISLAAASKHVRALERAGLVRRAVAGRTHRLRLAPGPLASAHQWLGFYERFWSGRLDVLERLLREQAHTPPAPLPTVPASGVANPAVPDGRPVADDDPPEHPSPEGDQP